MPLLLALLLPATAIAHDFEAGGIYYNIVNGEAVVTFQGTNYYSAAYSGDVVIPETVYYNGTTYSVTTIGEYAFRYCFGLTSASIPNSVTTIGEYAFQRCSGLTNVSIPNSVTTIGNWAFSYCSGLTSINIPNSVTTLGDYVLAVCRGLTSINLPNSITSIGNYAFNSCSGLTSINIPNSVNSIGIAAFSYCSGLTSINLPNSVTHIGNAAFGYCSGLTSINIPNSVTSIGDRAFTNCSGLTSVTIPNSVTSIGNYAFSGCSGVTSVVVASDNPIYDSRSNCNAIIETASNTLISGCQNSVIPNSVTAIGNEAFRSCTGLTSITIPNSVTTIGNEAFLGCTGLTSITIPNSVTTLGSFAFVGCSGLTSVTVAGDNPFYDSRDNCNAIIETASNTLIYGNQNTVIPNSVTAIGNEAFYNCTELTSITIPSSVTSISDYAFYICTGLTSINIPNSVTSIGNDAFEGCTGLTRINIPNSVTSIGNNAFAYCEALNDVYSFISYPDNITMGLNVFINIDNDYSNRTLYVPQSSSGNYQQDSRWSQYFGNIVEMPSEFEVDGIYYRLINANEVAVTYKYGHKYTGDIIIPETINFGGMTYSVTAIGNEAFEGCVNLTSVSIPNSVSSIGQWAFTGCTKLANINIPNSVTTIGNGTFQNCIKLANINIPNSVTTIGDNAFAYCYRLTEITVPESVTTIGLTTFSYCYSLAEVTWNARNCMLEYTYFDYEDHLPFAFCPSLKKIIIGSEVESIDDEIFCIYDPVYNNIDTVMCLAEVPPVISEDCFWTHTYEKATLCVPRASVDSYASATGWKEFVNRATIATDEDYPGDVDNDGTVTIGDVTLLIDYILGTNNHSINSVNADVDGDRYITIGDVTALIDDLLRKN